MNDDPLKKEKLVGEFIDRSGIDVAADIGSNTHWTARLAELDEAGSTVLHMTEGGADYFFTKLDYCEGDEVQASRWIAELLPGNRTELAYWGEAAPIKQLKVHRGRGDLVIVNPKDGSMVSVPYDADSLSEVTLQPGVFYTLRADSESVEPLFISGFYDVSVNVGELEVVVYPGDQTVETPDGVIEIPESFKEL